MSPISADFAVPALQPLRIAILLNSYRSKFLPAIQASYVRTISAVAPDAKLTFFEPANRPEEELPDPTFYDLIVFGGANVDARKSHMWILRIHHFLLRLVLCYPTQKILGICWGHQTIARVFGGKIADMDVPEMGVTPINLTDAGMDFFPHAPTTGSLLIQQHHRREVAEPGQGFFQLARENQVLMNERGTILTFQGHPEKDAETARLRMHDSTRWFGFSDMDEKHWAQLDAQIELEHEGHIIWQRILEWAREPVLESEMQMGRDPGRGSKI
ncbi:putative Glutamine amidotransferase domain-containing protein [Seiridium unicorne]|uniref:Glutamine amidotransferase domain-containing protein n=1 Tax=Seiridium unicorne TaxID=138068 RepID=A0ABR2UHJ3_9PEZI